MKYKEWLEQWLELYVKPSSKGRTYKMYGDIVFNHIIPNFGEYDMDDITPIEVQKYIIELLKNGNLKTGESLSANSVNAIIVIFQSSLKLAHMLGIAKHYEMNKIKRPKVVEKKVESFSMIEQKTIEQAVMNDKRDKMKGIIICLYTGLRIGELLALEWNDIDFANGEININKSCYDGKMKDGSFGRITDTPKTENSIRVIPLPKKLVPIIRAMKKNSNSPYVISGKNNVIYVRSYQRSFEILLKKLNIKHRGFHALRHTFATRAIECGMDVKTLSEILGHKNPTVTLNRYAHSLMDHKKDMMNRLGKLL